MLRYRSVLAVGALISALLLVSGAAAQERLPWERNDTYAQQPPSSGWPSEGNRSPDTYRPNDSYQSGGSAPPPRPSDPYAPPPSGPSYGANQGSQGYGANQGSQGYGGQSSGYGSPYAAPPGRYGEPYDPNYGEQGPREGYGPPPDGYDQRTYSRSEIVQTGHRFFGSVSAGLAGAVEYAFQQAGRPNGYILGEDAGGAFFAGLRYGEGMLFTKDAGQHRIFWQGPSLGYDFGGEGSKTMVLVYNLRHPSDIYNRFGGVEGSAYLVGGVSVQFQKHGNVVLAPIRSGVGVRLGANVGYLKYTRTPTWNPF